MHYRVDYPDESHGRGHRTPSRLRTPRPREMPCSGPGDSHGRGHGAAVWRDVPPRGSSLHLPGLPFSGFGSGR